MKKFTQFVDNKLQKLVLSSEQQHIDHDFQPFSPPSYSTNQDPSQYYSNSNPAFITTPSTNPVPQVYSNSYYPPVPSHQNVLALTYPTPITPNLAPPGYPSYTNTNQPQPTSATSPPNQSFSHINQFNHPSSSTASIASPGYPSVNNNSSAPPPIPQGNQSLQSPPSAYNLPQSVGASHIPSTPVQTPLYNNSVYSTPTATPTHANYSSNSTNTQSHTTPPPSTHPHLEQQQQPYTTSPPGTHPHLEQHTPQQQHSQFSNDRVSSSDPNPIPIQRVPDHIIYEKKLLDNETVQQAKTRIHSARVALGDTATADARKGLSRRIQTGNLNDIELFGNQLKNSQIDACELNYENFTDKVLCITVSYVHYEYPIGRFKFSPEQWNSLKVALANLSHFNVTEVRLWLDQCLWIRDVSQESWAHTGLVPYVIWPVISLGVKRYKHDRTTASFSRMWPFVEELAGLWSMGLMITKEMRSGNAESGNRYVLSYNLRHRLEPEKSMEVLLKNIYHGAADDHETGWQEDVEELKEMARLNISSKLERIAIGSDWRSKIARGEPKDLFNILSELPFSNPSLVTWGGTNIYLEGSRRMVKESDGAWDGVMEWMSGNKEMTSSTCYITGWNRMTKFNILTDKGEFQVLGKGSVNSGLWLLVAMDGRSSRFSRGRVSWTQIIHGENSCHLSAALTGKKTWVVEQVLREQTNEILSITHLECVNNLPIEWA